MITRQYKDLKGLKKQNLRDNMTTTELILNMLAETATKDITIHHILKLLKKIKKWQKKHLNKKRGGLLLPLKMLLILEN